MKRILLSVSIIVAVAAIVFGVTTAFFSDTETSTNNTFTAGSLDLTIDNHCWYNGKECKLASDQKYHWNGDVNQPICTCTWGLSNLDGKLFFDFSDLKPGDWGEDTISFHATNDTWACMRFKDLVSSDQNCIDPELDDEPGCGFDGKGELAENLYLVFWADKCGPGVYGFWNFPNAYPGDNIYQLNCDVLMFGSYGNTLFSGMTIPLGDSTHINVWTSPQKHFTAGQTYYIGKAWCYGNGYLGSGGFTCDGAKTYKKIGKDEWGNDIWQLVPLDNASQSDSLTGTVEFYTEQYRNNPGFICQ